MVHEEGNPTSMLPNCKYTATMVQIIQNKCQYYNSHQHFPNIEGFCHFSLLLDLAKHVSIIICFICLRYVSCNVQLLNKHCSLSYLGIVYSLQSRKECPLKFGDYIFFDRVCKCILLCVLL